MRLVTSVFITIIMLCIIPRLAERMGYPNKYNNLNTLLWILPITVFFNSIVDFCKEVLMGLERFRIVFLVTIIEYMGYLIGVTLLYKFPGVKALAVAVLMGELMAAVFGVSFINAFSPIIGKASHDAVMAKRILRYAAPIALLSVGGFVLMELDIFMLGLFSPPEQITSYSIAKNICSKVAHINYAITMGVMATFAVIEDDYKDKRRYFTVASIANMIIAIAVAGVLVVFRNTAILLLYGSNYQGAGEIIKVLAIYYILFAVSNYYAIFLDYRNHAVTRSIFYTSVIGLNLILNFILIPRRGAKGAAIATILSLIPYLVLVVVQSNREWKRKGNHSV